MSEKICCWFSNVVIQWTDYLGRGRKGTVVTIRIRPGHESSRNHRVTKILVFLETADLD